MTGQLTHSEVQELLGAYALDAVDADERAVIERHLAGCPRCRSEVDQHLETAAMLGHGASQPPDELWGRISGSLERETAPVEEPRLEPPAPRPERRGRRRYAFRAAAGFAVAAAAAAIAVLTVKVVDQGREIDRLSQPTVAPQVNLETAASVALSDASAERVVLHSEDGATAVDAVILPDGAGYVVRDNLPPLPDGRTYQLWAVVGDKVISAGILGNDPGVAAFHVDGDIGGLVITEEEAGGVVSSENPALAAWVQTV